MLEEADYSLTEQAHLGDQGRYAGDEVLLVRFFNHPKLDQTKSSEAGRPISVEVPYVQIMQPGNKDSIIQRPATEMDKARFSRHWRKFQDNQTEDPVEGTLLEEWPGISKSQVEELRYFNVRTLEQLVQMSDSNSQGMMGINVLKQRAKSYLEAASVESAASEIAARDQRIKQLEEAMERLQAEQDDSSEG